MPIESFDTIQDFLDYPTGHSIPTFNSGSGMSAERWGDLFLEFIREYIWDWIEEHGYQKMIMCDDEFIDELCSSEASECAYAEKMSAKDFPKLRIIEFGI